MFFAGGGTNSLQCSHARRVFGIGPSQSPSFQQCNNISTLSPGDNVPAPPMVYIAGEEMTHYAMNLIVDQWVKPYFDISSWEHYDLSCKSRDDTNDKVLTEAVEAGKRIGAIFKEPTITPSAIQVSATVTIVCT